MPLFCWSYKKQIRSFVKLSIITICLNPGRVLQTAVESVLAQTYGEVEHIIVDGGSSDGTLEILSRINEQTSNMKFISEPDKGLYDALNKGVRMATGDVIGFVHADDFLAHAEVLEHVAAEFGAPGVEAVYGDLQYVAGDATKKQCGDAYKVVRHWKSGEYSRKKLAWGWMPPHPTLYLKRSVYESTRLSNGEFFDTSFTCAADYDFMMRVLIRLQADPVYLPEVMVKMRVGGVSNRSLKHMVRKSLEDWRVIRRNRIGHLHTLIWKNLRKLPQFLSKTGR